MSNDLFGNIIKEKVVEVNIYADEIMNKKCPYTNDSWYYIGLVVEDCSMPILQDLINERFCNNFDENSKYYRKNNKIIHWSNISSADEINICNRWFKYIQNNDKFYFYLLGLNFSKLNKEEFDVNDVFRSVYNRFFRSAVIYALKTFFGNTKIIIKNIFHEQGQQKEHKYFPWHIIYRVSQDEENISFHCKEINFLTKDHSLTKESNILQLVDALMGCITTIIHGFEDSNRARNREKLLEILLPVVQKAISNEYGSEEKFIKKHFLIRFFPKEKTSLSDIERYRKHFYTNRTLHYIESISGQGKLF